MDGEARGIIGTIDVDRSDHGYREWLKEAVRKVQADAQRSADTHLLSFPLPERWGIDLYLKDESTHPTGSLKHRLARSLFLYGLCNGWIRPDKPVIEASSGSTAVSEAYFAKLIGVPFIAVMPRTTSREKCRLIEFHGGRCHFVDDPRTMYEESAALAAESGGHYMDQFTYAERATDWRGNNNIAESIYQQLRLERYPEPAWVVATAGTGGTSATIARYVHYMQYDTRVCRRPGELLLLRRLGPPGRPRLQRPRLTHRGHRPPPDGAQLRTGCDRPDDEGPGRGERRGRPRSGAGHRP